MFFSQPSTQKLLSHSMLTWGSMAQKYSVKNIEYFQGQNNKYRYHRFYIVKNPRSIFSIKILKHKITSNTKTAQRFPLSLTIFLALIILCNVDKINTVNVAQLRWSLNIKLLLFNSSGLVIVFLTSSNTLAPSLCTASSFFRIK